MSTSSKQRAATADNVSLPLLPRLYAMSVLKVIVNNAGLYMICGPKGDGKSPLMELVEQTFPFVIRVDLQNGSMDQAVRAMGEAIGYSFDYSADELAAKAAGFTVRTISEQLGVVDFSELLLVFELACNELRAEGALDNNLPVLILDHADRPKSAPSDDPKGSIIWTMVEVGHRPANNCSASWVAVTSDPQQKHEAWTKAGGRDSLMPIRVPPFTETEAKDLLARAIFERSHPKAIPTPKDLEEIKKEYASTLNFICGAVGTRARWLLRMLQFSRAPMKDTALTTEGMAVDSSFHPFLPKALRNSESKVDPLVWERFSSLITERKQWLKPLLAVPFDFVLPPDAHAEPGANVVAKRVLAADSALRDLLEAAKGVGAIEEKPKALAEGVPTGVTFESLEDKHFRRHAEDLSHLCEEHVLFYNHGVKTVEFESELMRRIVASWQAEPRHIHRMQLVNKLLEWQKASAAETKAKELEKGAGTDRAAVKALSEARQALDGATKLVTVLDGDIEVLRAKLRLLPKH